MDFDLFIYTLTNDNCFYVCSTKSGAGFRHNQRRVPEINNENKNKHLWVV